MEAKPPQIENNKNAPPHSSLVTASPPRKTVRHDFKNSSARRPDIAGSDSGGGAGVQADLKTFAAFHVHGASAIACLTAQNPRRVLAVEPCSAKMLRQQIEAVFEELPPAAAKTGMLFSAENIQTVASFFSSFVTRHSSFPARGLTRSWCPPAARDCSNPRR